MLGLASDDGGKAEHCDAVRDCHEGVHHVGEVPHHRAQIRNRGAAGCVADHHAAPEDEQQKHDVVREHGLLAKQVADSAVAVLAPTENGGVSEGQQADEQHQRAEYGNLLEGRGSEASARRDGAIGDCGGKLGIGEQRGHEHEAREQADDDGIPERAGHGNERLASGVLRRGGRRDERSRAHARFVGENAALEAELQSQGDRGANRAAGGARRSEGAHDDLTNGFTKVLTVQANNDDAAHHVEDGHDGNELLAHAGNRLDAAQNDNGHKRHDHDADEPLRNGRAVDERRVVQCIGERVRLGRSANAERGQRREQGKQHSKHAAELLVLEAALERIHRAAEHLAGVVFHAVLHADEDLGVLGGDTQNTGDPHPEDGARAAEQKARAHADDVARTDGGSERRGERAELGDVAVGVGRIVLGDRQLDAGAKLALDEASANRHEDVRAKQQQNHDGAPHEAVDGVDDVKRTRGGGQAFAQTRKWRYEKRCQEVFHSTAFPSGKRARWRAIRGKSLQRERFLSLSTREMLREMFFRHVSSRVTACISELKGCYAPANGRGANETGHFPFP